MVIEPTYTNGTGQSLNNQNYMPTLVVPEYQYSTQSGESQSPNIPRNISYPRTDVSLYPWVCVPGCGPQGSPATPASNNFGPLPQGYQLSSPGGQPYQYNYVASPAAPGYASYPPTAAPQPSQVDKRFQGIPQPNSIVPNVGAVYYDPRYPAGYHRTN
jgi:hypothetical protein